MINKICWGAVIVLFLSCGNGGNAGVEAGNSKVCGYVYRDDNSPAWGTLVFLFHPDTTYYLPIGFSDLVSGYAAQDTVDEKGYFELDFTSEEALGYHLVFMGDEFAELFEVSESKEIVEYYLEN
jgi:hypothetical protein